MYHIILDLGVQTEDLQSSYVQPGKERSRRRRRMTSRRRFAGDDQLQPPEEYPPLTCSSVLDLQRGELAGGVGNGGGSSGREEEGVK